MVNVPAYHKDVQSTSQNAPDDKSSGIGLLDSRNMQQDDQSDESEDKMIKDQSKVKHSSLVILLVAFPLILIAVSLGWVIIPCFIQHQISNKVAISPDINPELYAAWLSPPVPVYLKVYVFNVSNPEQVRLGGLPHLQEVGPYVFGENRTKVNISHDEASDTVTYKEVISYHFHQELSGSASLEDVVTIMNVPFVAAAIKIAELTWPLNELVQTTVVGFKESVFVNKTVREALFEGWTVPFLEKIEKDYGLSLVPNNKFGFFIGQNATAQGPYTVSRGSIDKATFGEVVKFKNETTLNFWGDRSSNCNQIRGTDGSIFPPFVTKNRILTIFNAELCRSLDLTYEKESSFDGIRGYRFTAPKSVLSDPRESLENRCFCPDLEDFPEQCPKQGAINLGHCRDGAPVAISTPHFLDGSHEYINMSGLTPDPNLHETFMIIEPLTGLILQASKKIQINLMLQPVKGLSALRRVPQMLFPLVWADECAELNEENSIKFKSTLNQLWLFEMITKWVLLAFSLGIALFLVTRKIMGDRGYKNASLDGKYHSKIEASQQAPLRLTSL